VVGLLGCRCGPLSACDEPARALVRACPADDRDRVRRIRDVDCALSLDLAPGGDRRPLTLRRCADDDHARGLRRADRASLHADVGRKRERASRREAARREVRRRRGLDHAEGRRAVTAVDRRAAAHGSEQHDSGGSGDGARDSAVHGLLLD